MHVLRAVIASVAAGANMPVDTIDELRIAVDEAVTLLLASASASVVRVEIDANDASVAVVASTDATRRFLAVAGHRLVVGLARPVRPLRRILVRAYGARPRGALRQAQVGPGRRVSKRAEPSGRRVRADEPDVLALFAELPEPHARDALVRRFLPLAEHLARRFAGRGESPEDLAQVASLGLLHAIDRFDPEREVQFSTYAAVTIVGELKRHFRDKGWSVRVPRNLQESAMLVNKTIASLWQEVGRSPTVAEVAVRAQLSEDEVVEAMEAVQAYSASSIDAPLNPDGTAPSETLGTVDEAYEVSEGWLSIAPVLHDLPERERRILYLRFFKNATQTEIAEEVGISQMHVSRLLTQTLAKVRERMTDEGAGE